MAICFGLEQISAAFWGTISQHFQYVGGGSVLCVCARRATWPIAAAYCKEQVGVGGWEDESKQPAQDVPDPNFSESLSRRLLETKDTLFTAKSV